jgi:putative spermidine/putrescine transport system substrate-binding protein
MLTRRTILLSAAALSLSSPSLAQQRTLVINSFGGAYEQTHRKAVIEPFEKLHNVKVNVVTVYSADALAQLRAQRAAPQFDVLHFSGGQEAVAAREGLLEKATLADLPTSGAHLYPFATAGLERGEGPVMHVAAMGLIYHADKVKPAPTSWKDLLDPKFKGRVVLTDFSNTYGLLSALMLNQALGGSIDNVEPGFNALQSLVKDSTVIARSPDIQLNFVQNDAWLAPYAQDYAFALRKAGVPARFALPQEGVAGSLITSNAVAGRPNRDLAMKFIDFSLRAEAQEMWARDLRYSPVRRDVTLDPETAADVVYGEEAVRKLVVFDPIKVGEKRQAWVDQWNRMLGK